MTDEMNQEINDEKYLVVWVLNGMGYNRICDTVDEAMRIRQKLIDKGRYEVSHVSIHLKQINKYGDAVTV